MTIEEHEPLNFKEFALEYIQEAVYLIDKHAKFLYVNLAASLHLGYTKDELLTMGVADVDPNFPHELWEEHWNDLKKRKNLLFSTTHRTKYGLLIPVEVNANFIMHEGEACNIALIREKTEEQILKKEIHYYEHYQQTLLDNFPFMVWLKDKQSRLLTANAHYARIANAKSVQELEGKTDFDFFPSPLAQKYINDDLSVMQEGKAKNAEEMSTDEEGKPLWIETWKTPVIIDGEIVGMVGCAHDISERKIQEEQLRIKELAFRTLAENSPDSIVRYDKNLKRTYVNATWERANSILRSEILGKSPAEQAGRITGSVDEFEAMLRRVVNTGKSEEFELEWKNKEEKVFFFSFHSVAEYDGAGNIISVLTISRDISTQKELQSALSSQEQLFRALAENSPDSIIRYDTACRRTYVNPIVERVFGISANELLGKSLSETALLPESILYENALKKVLNTAQEFSLEIQFSLPNGQQIWGDVRLIPEFNKEGKIVSVLSVGRDITERKKLEIHLNATLSQFEQFVNNITEMAWIKDKNSHYVIVNQVLANRFGVNAKDMIGKHDFDFFDEKTSRAHIEVDLKVMREEITLKIEEMISSNPDHEIWIESIKNPFKDSNGEIIGTIGTARNITERKYAEKQMAFMAQHDTLTDLPNRALAKDRADQSIAYAKRNKSKVALLFIDLDGFKTINDSLGHLAGDTMLKIVASRLKKYIRQTDTLSRQGGDEFLMMLTDVRNADDVSIVAQKLLSEFEKPFQLDMHSISSSISIGIALYPDDGKHFDALLQCADTAMYKAKEVGRNTYCFFTKAMNQEIFEHLHIQNDLKQALVQQQFVLYYQPQIDLKTNTISGAEALLRWNHPQNGLVPPMKFIPIAESSGLILQIGEWVIYEACHQAAKWNDQGMNITVAVNISAVQFKRGNLEHLIEKALESSSLNPQYLELELTESILIHDTENVLQAIKRLKSLGIKLSIDDFGTGYSSLSYLKRFAVDKLKIDQSFVRDILKDQEDNVIVKAIIQMAQSLGLKTIAEGVEDQEVVDLVHQYGCDEVQGFYFAKPMPHDEFLAYCKKTV